MLWANTCRVGPRRGSRRPLGPQYRGRHLRSLYEPPEAWLLHIRIRGCCGHRKFGLSHWVLPRRLRQDPHPGAFEAMCIRFGQHEDRQAIEANIAPAADKIALIAAFVNLAGRCQRLSDWIKSAFLAEWTQRARGFQLRCPARAWRDARNDIRPKIRAIQDAKGCVPGFGRGCACHRQYRLDIFRRERLLFPERLDEE